VKTKVHSRNRVGNRWTMLIGVVVLALLVGGCGADKPKVYRVGLISGGAFVEINEGFKAKLAELGYVEDQNIVYLTPESEDEDVQTTAEKYVDDEVDLIFTSSTPAALAAKAATQGTDIPVVFTYASTENTNLVESVRQPGGNITGVRYPGPEQTSRRLEILVEMAPQVERLWVGYQADNPNTPMALEALHSVAPGLGVTLVEVPATTLEELQADLAARAALDDPGVDGLILMPDGLSNSPEGEAMFLQFAAEHKIPLAGSFPYTVEQGAVFGNANVLSKVGEQAAPLADKIFRGTQAGTIPVVTPDQDLWINYKVAQELGLAVPEGLLSLATEIIR
jgi:putative ABC transport system substrate-binding protein